MNIQDLADRLAEAHELSKIDARAIIDTMVDAIAAAAKEGDEVALPGFGKFKVRERKEREARNPQTGAMVKVPAQRKLAFLPAKALKDAMNPGSGAKSAKSSGKTASKSGGKAASRALAQKAFVGKGAGKGAGKTAGKTTGKSAGKSGKAGASA